MMRRHSKAAGGAMQESQYSQYGIQAGELAKNFDEFGADFLPELERVIETYAIPGPLQCLEWGSGLSTQLLNDLVVRRGGFLVTLDDNPEYLAGVAGALRHRNVVEAIPADLRGRIRGQEHEDRELAYSTAPLARDTDFDLVLIDGRRRLECSFSALLMTHEKSLVVLHDYRRARYQAVAAFYDTLELGNQFRVMRPKPAVLAALAPGREETRRSHCGLAYTPARPVQRQLHGWKRIWAKFKPR
jgi:hypothetical protein